MGSPKEYFVDYNSGVNGMTNDGTIDSPWKTVNYALSTGIALKDGGHDSNGVQINIKALDSATPGVGEGEPDSIDVDGTYGETLMGSFTSYADDITHGAPLIFRGYQTASGDWYPGKPGDAPTLFGYHYPYSFASRTDFAIVSDQVAGGSSNYKVSSHLLFYDLVFKGFSTAVNPLVQAYSANSFVNCQFTGTEADNPIQLSNDNTFVNCHFSDMGDSGSGDNCINHSGDGLTLINCVFDFLEDAKPFYCIKSTGTGSHHLTGNVFMCGPGCRVMNWSGTPSGPNAGLLVLINNTFYSNAGDDGGTRVQPFGGNNVAKRFLAIDNLMEGWTHSMVQKSNNNVLAWGGNSAYNNTTNFPDGTDPDVWFEFKGGNFSATDANSNKTLAESPFLDAGNKKMSCRPARTSGGDEAVVGQGLSLNEEASTIVKRGDRGAVPRGPLNPPVGGGVIG